MTRLEELKAAWRPLLMMLKMLLMLLLLMLIGMLTILN